MATSDEIVNMDKNILNDKSKQGVSSPMDDIDMFEDTDSSSNKMSKHHTSSPVNENIERTKQSESLKVTENDQPDSVSLKEADSKKSYLLKEGSNDKNEALKTVSESHANVASDQDESPEPSSLKPVAVTANSTNNMPSKEASSEKLKSKTRSVSRERSSSRRKSADRNRENRSRSKSRNKDNQSRSRSRKRENRSRSKSRSRRSPDKTERDDSKSSRNRETRKRSRSNDRSRSPERRRRSRSAERQKRRERSESSDRYEKSKRRSSSRDTRRSHSRRRGRSRSRSHSHGRRGHDSSSRSNRRNSRNRSPPRRPRSREGSRGKSSRSYQSNNARPSRDDERSRSGRNAGDKYEMNSERRERESYRDGDSLGGERRGGWRNNRDRDLSDGKPSDFFCQEETRNAPVVGDNERRPIPSLMSISCRAPAQKTSGDGCYDPSMPTDDDSADDLDRSKDSDKELERNARNNKNEVVNKPVQALPQLPNLSEPPPNFFQGRPLMHEPPNSNQILGGPGRSFGMVRPSNVEIFSGAPVHQPLMNSNMVHPGSADFPRFVHGMPPVHLTWRPENQPQRAIPLGLQHQMHVVGIPGCPPPGMPGVMPPLPSGMLYHSAPPPPPSLPSSGPPLPIGQYPTPQNRFMIPPPPGMPASIQADVSSSSAPLMSPMPPASVAVRPVGLQLIDVPSSGSVPPTTSVPGPLLPSSVPPPHFPHSMLVNQQPMPITSVTKRPSIDQRISRGDLEGLRDASGAPVRSSYDARENESDVTSEEDDNLGDSSPIAVFRNDSAREFAASVSGKPWHTPGKEKTVTSAVSAANSTDSVTRVYGSLVGGPRVDAKGNKGKSIVPVISSRKDDDIMDLDEDTSSSCAIISSVEEPAKSSAESSASDRQTESLKNVGFTMPFSLQQLFNSAGISHALNPQQASSSSLLPDALISGKNVTTAAGMSTQSTLRAHVAPMPQASPANRPHAAIEPQTMLKGLGAVGGGLDVVEIADLKKVLDSVRTASLPNTSIAVASSSLGSGNSNNEAGPSRSADKLQVQEVVVEEVKLALKPHYSKGAITKHEYKDIMRRAVPKICHSCKGGHVVTAKVQDFIDQYVDKVVKQRKSSASSTSLKSHGKTR